jgi:low affinity Fe/Cu permease
MQLNHFKIFIVSVIREGNRLQKKDITGAQLTTKWMTNTQLLSLIISIITVLYIIPKGFSDNFAGYIISFLGIFIGLFTSIVISMIDKSKPLLIADENANQIDKGKLMILKNYLVQFTGLTAYAILLALVIIILLCLVLLSDSLKVDTNQYHLVKKTDEITLKEVVCFIKLCLIALHRFFVIYLLCNFFIITAFSITSYFSYVLSEYKKIKIQ